MLNYSYLVNYQYTFRTTRDLCIKYRSMDHELVFLSALMREK